MNINFSELSNKEIIQLFCLSKKELKNRNLIRTNNVLGDLGETLAIECYKSDSKLPNLYPAPIGTENWDAASRKGKTYSIKSTSTKVTGVFYGLEPKGSSHADEKKFDYVIVCIFDSNYELQKILELDWDTFLKNKSWHSRMNAWKLNINKQLISQSKIVFSKE